MKKEKLQEVTTAVQKFCEQYGLVFKPIQEWHIRIYRPDNEKNFIDLYPMKKRYFLPIRQHWGDYQREISLIQTYFQIQSNSSFAAEFEMLPFQEHNPEFYLSMLQKRNAGAEKLLLDVPMMLDEYHSIKLSQALFKIIRMPGHLHIEQHIKQLFPNEYERVRGKVD